MNLAVPLISGFDHGYHVRKLQLFCENQRFDVIDVRRLIRCRFCISVSIFDLCQPWQREGHL